MNKAQIFPDSIINNTTEAIIHENRKVNNVLYITVLLVIIIAFISLFFIKIDISVKAVGVIKPIGENNIVTSPQTGRLYLQVKENNTVQAGDTLFKVVSENTYAQLPSLQVRQKELMVMINDINKLTRFTTGTNPSLKSSIYTQQFFSYIAQLDELTYKEQATRKRYLRDKQLYEKKVISLSDFDDMESEYKNTLLNIETFQKKQKAQWENDKNNYENELRDIETKISQIRIQENEAVVYASVTGSIQSIENVTNGMYVHSGQQILILSPDGNLVAECYVLPKDIGFVNDNLPCRIQVDAFNYNQWGILKGDVKESHLKDPDVGSNVVM